MKLNLSVCLAAGLLWLSEASAEGQRFEFDFAQSDHGFVAGFSDYLTNNPAIYQFTNNWCARPSNLGGAPALFISSVNHSDDIFMFWKKRITGLIPSTSYQLTMEVDFASKYPTGMVGVGGPPGDGVAFKTGATPFEPLVIVPAGEISFRMNLDKGNQLSSGTNMTFRGTIAKPVDGNLDYVILTRHHHGNPQAVTTAADGSLWLIFGTDSGFEGETALYYTRLTAWLNPSDKPELWIECDQLSGTFRLIWNQGSLQSSTNLSDWLPAVGTNRPYLYLPGPETNRFWRVKTSLP